MARRIICPEYVFCVSKNSEKAQDFTVEYKTGTPLNIFTGGCSPYQFSGAFGSSCDGVDMADEYPAKAMLKSR